MYDIEGFTRSDRGDPDRAELRARLDRHIEAGLSRAGVTVSRHVRNDTGDGVLLVIDPDVPKPRLLKELFLGLAGEVEDGNANRPAAEHLRLRAVADAGEVTQDRNGSFGRDMNRAFRLLEAEALRDRLRETSASVVVAVSDAFFEGTVSHRYEGVDPADFERVVVTVKGTEVVGWIWLPRCDRLAERRLDAGSDAGTGARTGRHAGQRDAESWPEITNLPKREQQFTGRIQELAELRGLLAGEGRHAVPVYGLPGVGKTQLVLEYAHRHAADYDVIWYVDGSRRSEVLAALEALLDRLVAAPSRRRDLPGELDDALGRLGRWLLIVDDAGAEPIADCLPVARNGDIVVTTWCHDFGRVARLDKSLKLGPFIPEDARRFVSIRTGSYDASSAERLARNLGNLPLALEQAGDYCNRASLTLEEYLRLYERHGEDLLCVGHGENPDRRSLEVTFGSAFERLECRAPLAAQLLMLLSFFAPATVPDRLVMGSPELLPTPLRVAVQDELTYPLQASGPLVRHSLAEREADGLRLHHLVQAVVRRRLPQAAQEVWAACAIRILRRAWPDDPRDPAAWPDCQRLVPHTITAASLAERLGVLPEETASLLRTVGIFQMEQAMPVAPGTERTSARSLFERALTLLEARLRPDDPEIALTLMHLGRALRRLDQFQEAKAALERAARILEAAPGEQADVPSVLTHLGATLRDLGDHAGAKATLQRALACYEVGGRSDARKVAWTLTHLGRVLRRLGDHRAARETLEQALRLAEEAPNPADHQIAEVLLQLGRVLRRVGDYSVASSGLERALRINEQVFGLDHHRTAEVLVHIGAVLRDKGDLGEARARLERALTVNVAWYGTEHYSTARTRAHLGRVLRRSELLEDAREHLERALRDTENARGHDHLQVAWTLVHLSTVLQGQGHNDHARAVLERALAITERIYPPDHPDVAWVLTHLAAVTILEDPRYLLASQDALDRALRITEEAYGKDHLDVAWVLTHTGDAFQHAGQLDHARPLLERALTIIEDAAADGQPHRQVIPTMTALGQTLRSLGHTAKARAMLRAAYDIASGRLGPNHPETKAAWKALQQEGEGSDGQTR